MVIMSMQMYEEKMQMIDVYGKLAAAQLQVEEGKVLDGDASIKGIKEKYGL
jgi:hypothetical protein